MGTAEVAGQRTDVETWWRDAVVYQLYIRSFADGNGDGIGDIAGIRARLGHLRDLGVDACGSTLGTPHPWPTEGTTWPTIAPSSRCSARVRRQRR